MKFCVFRSLCATVLTLVPICAVAAAPPAPTVVQPGAPGQPSRDITPEQSIDLARTPRNAANVKFMQDMIIHHAQAVEMVALLKTHTNRESMRLLGERISVSQTDEMAMMRTWLSNRGEALPDVAAHHDMVMKGMLTPAQMKTLAAAKGDQFDKLFLAGMIQHHQGALDMVHALLAMPGAGEEPQLFDFLTSVEADQSAEINRMQAMLADLQ